MKNRNFDFSYWVNSHTISWSTVLGDLLTAWSAVPSFMQNLAGVEFHSPGMILEKTLSGHMSRVWTEAAPQKQEQESVLSKGWSFSRRHREQTFLPTHMLFCVPRKCLYLYLLFFSGADTFSWCVWGWVLVGMLLMGTAHQRTVASCFSFTQYKEALKS